MDQNKWYLTGAWAAMAAVGAYSLYKGSESPAIDPTIARLCRDLDQAQRQGPNRQYAPDPLPQVPNPRGPWDRVGYVSPPEGSDTFHTKCVGTSVVPKTRPILVLPYPVMVSGTGDQDGASLTWTTEDRAVDHRPWMIPRAATPSGFAVLRQSPRGPAQKIAELGPSARSYTDPSTEPHTEYLYWVTLTGLETDRSNTDGTLRTGTTIADRPVQVRTPSATRLKLIGGGKTQAVLRMDTYDRATKAWVSRTLLAAPGELVAGTGWSLKTLRFDEFTLVADVTDDLGVARTLSTRD
ncbi:MAG TPA: hypothetical protein VKW04_10645 [Planctomycetota bacterium]|nr:hypothetical protein [Planctomycetota bacterium]